MKSLLVCLLFASALDHAYASEPVDEKFRIALGGYSVVRYDSTMSLTDKALGAGISINPNDALGLQTEQTVVRLDGHYLFNTEHSLTFSVYSISSKGYKSLEKDINWQDENGNEIIIPVDTRIDTSFDYDIYKLGYMWTFYHTDKVDMAIGAGLHTTHIAIGLKAGGSYTGADPRDIKTTVPLPVLSYSIIYRVTPKFQWYLKSEFFALKFADWDGVFTDNALGMEYRAWDHIGLGLGIASDSLKLTEKTGDYAFNYDNRLTGALFYLAGYF